MPRSWRNFHRERRIRWLMSRFGLTRSEAEGLLAQTETRNMHLKRDPVVAYKTETIRELSDIEEDPLDDFVWKALGFLAGATAGFILFDWLLKRLNKRKRKTRRMEVEEWLV